MSEFAAVELLEEIVPHEGAVGDGPELVDFHLGTGFDEGFSRKCAEFCEFFGWP